MIKLFLPFLFLIVFNQNCFTQSILGTSIDENYKDGFVVDSIAIQGNDITDKEIILRELTFNVGDTINNKILLYNSERVFSLGLFTKVRLVRDPLAFPKNVVQILVNESWYIYPIPLAELKDRDWKKISYGFDVVIQNFRGRNETLRARTLFGYDPSLSLSYSNPYFIWDENIYLELALAYHDTRNISSIAKYLYGGDFNQKFISAGIGIGKRLGLFQKAGISLNYNYIQSPSYIKGISASNDRIDRLFSIGASYSYDTRDLRQFAREGILGAASFEFKGLGIDGINYQIASIDFREYRKLIGELGAKWRLASRFTMGKLVPFYDYSYLGYSERIRGHFFDESEGNNLYLASLEFNYPIVKDFNISLDFVPIIPDQLLSYRVALYLQMFGDTGATQFKGQHISINDFNSGYGLGLTLLILPYNIVRFEVAFNEHFRSEFIFDIGASF